MNITGELILEKEIDAKKLLYSQQDFQHKLSLGWLEKLNLRYDIKSFRLYGENGSLDIQNMKMKVKSIRTKIDQFFMKNIFTTDETGLFYRLQANHFLATK